MSLQLDHQLCFALYTASRQVIQRYTPLLKPLKLTYTQYLTMLVLWEEQPQTVKALGNRLYLDSGTLTPLLKKLASLGYIERQRSAEDERVVEISLTPKGIALRDQAKTIPHQIAACYSIPPEKLIDFVQTLKLIRDDANHQTCHK